MQFHKILATMVATVVATVTATVTAAVIWAPPVLAEVVTNADGERVGVAVDKQINFQAPATEIMERIISFHDLLMIIITLTTIFVFVLLGIVMVKFNRKANPVPSKTSHHVGLEIAWTLIPVIILVVIAIPSFKLLYYQDTIPDADVVIKATGNQWYWSYEYTDEDGLGFDSIMLPDSYFADDMTQAVAIERASVVADIQHLLDMDTEPQMYRLLETDTRIVVPVNKIVKLVVTASDVLHAWTIPAFGVKVDAVPGRINELWFNATVIGTYYGQCSELCGVRHAFMPIVVQVVSDDDYAAWLVRAKDMYADSGSDTVVRLASVQPAS
jgi:cytochrome c oxidase subunit 2